MNKINVTTAERLIQARYNKQPIPAIIEDLFKAKGTTGKVADELQISRQYLWKLIKKYNLNHLLSRRKGGRPTWQEANKKAWKRHQAAQ